MSDQERILERGKSLKHLNDYQLSMIDKIINQLRTPFLVMERLESSDLISDCVMKSFGDTLRLHHCFSKEPFTKDKFEYAIISALNVCGLNAGMAPKGNPGHDIIVNGTKISLKTQADKNIKSDKLHISKFMELGKGVWGNDLNDLNGLLNNFISHLDNYSRIFSLRCLSKHPGDWHYELVEIPKSLLLEAINGDLIMKFNSKQFPKPGYCSVYENEMKMKFQLYFDGGSERKLQIKNLMKDYCTVHADWKFSDISLLE
jgi:type II restriction enzyme